MAGGMTIEAFTRSLGAEAPPDGLDAALRALWWDGNGDWARAHEHADSSHDADAAWVHAYLHRKEGDAGNAGYWYRRAGRTPAAGPLDDERALILRALIARA